MEYEFPVTISLNGGRGDSGDCMVSVDLSDVEVSRLCEAAKDLDCFAELCDGDGISDIADKVEEAFREDQLGYLDDCFLEQAAERFDKEVEDLDDDEKWEYFNWMYDYSIHFPDDLDLEEE